MDPQTLYLVLVTTLLVQTVALLLTWLQNREEIGLRDWGLAAALMTIGSLAIMLGLFFSSTTTAAETPLAAQLLRDAGTGLAGTGWLMAWLGTRRFYRQTVMHYGWVPVFWVLLTLALIPGNALPNWRVGLISTTIVVFGSLVIYALERGRKKGELITRMASGAMGIVVFSWLARAGWAFSHLHSPAASHLIDVLCVFSSILMSLVFTLSLILLTNQRIHARLRMLAARDSLTGVLNRRAFFEASRPLLARLQRDPSPLALAVVDLDFFKHVNDRFGHAAGDEVLRSFARVAQGTVRDGDLFARYGGEEFVILFQNNTLEQAVQAIDRLRDAWGGAAPDGGEETLTVTFSAGVCHVRGPGEINLESLLAAADRALYQAKGAGRNCTRVTNIQAGSLHKTTGTPLNSVR